MRTSATIITVALFASLGLIHAKSSQAQEGFVKSARYLPATVWEDGVLTGKGKSNWKYDPNAIYADRKVYWNDDHVGQCLVTFLKADWQGKRLTLEVLGANGAVILTGKLGPMTQPKVALLLAMNTLKPGQYRLKATLASTPPVIVETAFERADKANPVVPFPAEGIPIRLDPQGHVKDGAWPVTTGVPFPQGTITDVSGLTLFEDGRQVPAQVTQVCTWHPEADGVKSSVSWARLSFVGRYADGKPRAYALRQAADRRPAATPRVSVASEDNVITVDTGVVRFQVNRKSFRGVEAAWYDADGDGRYADNERVVGGASGAYVVDARGSVYESGDDGKPSVVIEEQGPVRAVIAAEGWYTKKSEQGIGTLCKFRTRIHAAVGEPMIRVHHHTIVTFDSNKVQLADVGLRVGVTEPQKWSLGVDGKTLDGDAPAKDSVFLHQYRWNRLRVVGTGRDETEAQPAGPAQPPVGVPGQKSDGWFTLTRNSPGAVTVLLRDVWQKFPKEVEMDKDGFVLHFWPKHGIETFTRAEMIAKANIYKLWYHQHGRLLDLKFPGFVYDALKEMNKAKMWDPEEMTEHAKSGNAQGVAIGNDFILRFHKADAADMPAQAALAQQDPHAIPDPNWNVKTLVEGRMSAHDPKRFSKLEEDLNTFWTDYMKAVVDAGTEYGMWTYANVHDNWQPGVRTADLHRVWSASHYRNVSTAWLFYFRGCSPEVLRWAQANTDHFMDVDTVNYASMGQDDKGNPRVEFKFHIPGAMYHAKGFTPWGSTAYGEKAPDVYAGIWGHFTNPDAYRYRYLIEGNGRAWDLYRLWADSMKRYDIPPTWGRDVNGTFGEELSYYRATWDPDFLQLICRTAEGMLSAPLDQMPHPYDHPGWHRFWYSRLYELTRDERVKQAVLEYSKNYGRKFATMMAWCYQQTGDKSYLTVNMPYVYDTMHCVYRNPGDPDDGCRNQFSAYGMYYYQEMPYWIQALADAGITEITPGKEGRSLYPSHATHPDFTAEKSAALMLLALKPDDREFTLRLESIPGYDVYSPVYRVIAPSGKVVHEQPKPAQPGTTRFLGDKAIVVKVPKDGETGLYRVDCRSWEGMRFFAPFTDLPVEGTLIDPNQAYESVGRCDMYLMPIGDKARVKFTWEEKQLYPARMYLGYVRVDDAKGKTLFETTLLAGSKRASANLELDVTKDEPPYRLYQFSSHGPAIKWSGTAKGLVSARSAETVRVLAAEIEKATKPAAAAKK